MGTSMIWFLIAVAPLGLLMYPTQKFDPNDTLDQIVAGILWGVGVVLSVYSLAKGLHQIGLGA